MKNLGAPIRSRFTRKGADVQVGIFMSSLVGVVTEGGIFSGLRQLKNQKFDEYLVQVKAQAKKCEFGQLEDSLVKDMKVLGTRSNSVRERLFTEKDLELGKAVTICRSAEQAHEQVQEMNADAQDKAVVATMHANGPRFGQMDQRPEYRTAMYVKRHGHDTRRPKNFIVVDVQQSMANSCVQHLANNVEDVVRMVISAGCALSESQKFNNQELIQWMTTSRRKRSIYCIASSLLKMKMIGSKK
jgi:hypothetical protein